MVTAPPRILGLVEGDSSTVLSGIPHHLLRALGRRYPLERLSYAPDGYRRLALAAATFHPSRERWRARFHTSALAHAALSRTLGERLRMIDQPFDLALQIMGWVRGQPRPYALYVDQTRLMALRGWPSWLPFGRRERSRILALERDMYERASYIFTMGSTAIDSLVADYGVDPNRIGAVGGGLSFERIPQETADLSRGAAILFVGRDFERKGGDCLVEAFTRVRRDFPDAELHLVGTSRRFDVPGVTSWGILSGRDQLGDLYRRARVFCLPSRYEPYGLALIEAMAHGVPCVGTSVGSIPDILGGGESGLIVPPSDPVRLSDAISTLLTDDALARRLVATGRQRVEAELTWDAVAERMSPGILRAAAGAEAVRQN